MGWKVFLKTPIITSKFYEGAGCYICIGSLIGNMDETLSFFDMIPAKVFVKQAQKNVSLELLVVKRSM